MWLAWNPADSHFISSITFFFLPPAYPSPPKSKLITGNSQSQKELQEAWLLPPTHFTAVLSPLGLQHHHCEMQVLDERQVLGSCEEHHRSNSSLIIDLQLTRDLLFFMNQNRSKIFFNLFIFNWRIVALQNFVVFCQNSTWISHRYTYTPLEPPSISLHIAPL